MRCGVAWQTPPSRHTSNRRSLVSDAWRRWRIRHQMVIEWFSHGSIIHPPLHGREHKPYRLHCGAIRQVFQMMRGCHTLSLWPQDGSRKPRLRVHPFYESGSPGTRFERLIEILRLMGHLQVLEFHYANREERFLVVVEDIFSNPQTIGSENTPDFEALFVRLKCAALLDVCRSTNTFS